MFNINFANDWSWTMDLLVLEATALLTEPRPLPSPNFVYLRSFPNPIANTVMGHSRSLFLYCHVFYKQLRVKKCVITVYWWLDSNHAVNCATHNLNPQTVFLLNNIWSASMAPKSSRRSPGWPPYHTMTANSNTIIVLIMVSLFYVLI